MSPRKASSRTSLAIHFVIDSILRYSSSRANYATSSLEWRTGELDSRLLSGPQKWLTATHFRAAALLSGVLAFSQVGSSGSSMNVVACRPRVAPASLQGRAALAQKMWECPWQP